MNRLIQETDRRIQVYKETQEYFKNYNRRIKDTVKKTPADFEDLHLRKKYEEGTHVLVLNNDIIDDAMKVVKRGYNLLLLNMADPAIPGGCVDAGAATQEEECFRRGNYFLHLLPRQPELYPLRDLDILLSHRVAYCRYGRKTDYAFMEYPVYMDTIAAHALINPKIEYNDEDSEYFNDYDYANEEDREMTREKIRMIFRTGYENGNDVLCLSAIGCGAFCNPPRAVAKIFNEVLQEFDGCFYLVTFSILGKNYPIFKEIIEEKGF